MTRIYRAIVAPERPDFIVCFCDGQGRITRHPWSENWPLEILSTVILTERAGRTTVTVTWRPHEASAEENRSFDESRDSIRQGWTGTFEQLDNYLSSL